MARLAGRVVPRVFTPPLVDGPPGPCGCGCALTPDTSLGFDCASFAEDMAGVVLFPWQRWLLIHALELLPSGMLRFRKVIVLVARQNGKSMLAEVLSLFFMYVLAARLVLGTAQDLATAEDIWEDTLALAQESEVLAPRLMKPKMGKGSKEFSLVTGEKYKVKSANRRSGRGSRKVKLVLLDELREHQTWDAWGAITKTTNAEPEAQVWALSNAGDASSIVLRYLRMMAHKALGDPDGVCAEADPSMLLDDSSVDVDDITISDTDDTLGIFEWSAPPGAKVFDRDGWTWANPSLGHTITERTLESDAKTDPEPVFRVECLCQWVDGALDGPFPPGAWEAGRVEAGEAQLVENQIVGDVTACVEVSWDRSKAAVVYAGRRADGRPQGEVVAYLPGADAALEWLRSPERTARPVQVLIRTSSPASSIKGDLEAAGLQVVDWQGVDVSRACGALYDLVRGPADADERHVGVLHAAHTALDVGAATAVSRPFGDLWAWDLAKSPVDVSPLFAFTGAVWGVLHPVEAPFRSRYEDDDAEVVYL